MAALLQKETAGGWLYIYRLAAKHVGSTEKIPRYGGKKCQETEGGWLYIIPAKHVTGFSDQQK